LDGRFTGDDVTGGSFLSLKPRLIAVLIGALQTETDTSNTQILLGQNLILILILILIQILILHVSSCSLHVAPGPGLVSAGGLRSAGEST